MKNNLSTHVISCVVLIALGIAFLNPFHIWMTTMFHMTILAVLVAAFGVFAALIIREQGGDEREQAHRMLAGRAAFLTGTSLLLIGIVWQACTGTVDAWLIVILCAMVLAKMAARLYGERML